MNNSEMKTALRTFYREKGYALINLSGLSLAIACCLILGLYLKSELTYDRHHLKHKQIYRVLLAAGPVGSVAQDVALTGWTLGPVLKEDFPVIKSYVRFLPAFKRLLIRGGDKALYWEDVYCTDKNVFDVFTHKIIYGNPETALNDPSSAAVSETFAKRHFGDINPVGKTIWADATETTGPAMPRKITLVFRDLPDNTHLKYDVLFRISDVQDIRNPMNMNSGVLFTYLVMPEDFKPREFKAINDAFYKRYIIQAAKIITWIFRFQPLASIHFDTGVGYDRPTGNKYYVYGFIAVAIFILLVACINYINLAIARSAKRAKEIGMRRILGVPKFNLIARFLCEAVLFSMIATVFGVALVEIVLKFTPISDLLGKSLSLRFTDEVTILGWILGLGLIIGLLSGLYPAFYLSSISPISALSGGYSGNKGVSFRLREALVLTQFTVSAIVIACTLLMAAQMRYIANKPMGFEKHNRIVINL
jgi:putative ABC transport system permease protein